MTKLFHCHANTYINVSVTYQRLKNRDAFAINNPGNEGVVTSLLHEGTFRNCCLAKTLQIEFVYNLIYPLHCFIQATISASTNLHGRCLKSVMKAPMSFFDANPAGRILNRFSKDMDEGNCHNDAFQFHAAVVYA